MHGCLWYLVQIWFTLKNTFFFNLFYDCHNSIFDWLLWLLIVSIYENVLTFKTYSLDWRLMFWTFSILSVSSVVMSIQIQTVILLLNTFLDCFVLRCLIFLNQTNFITLYAELSLLYLCHFELFWIFVKASFENNKICYLIFTVVALLYQLPQVFVSANLNIFQLLIHTVFETLMNFY